MNAAAGKHVGLPFVLPSAPEELLGSWLLRMAQLYGVDLAPLLSRLGMKGGGRAKSWVAKGQGSGAGCGMRDAGCGCRQGMPAYITGPTWR